MLCAAYLLTTVRDSFDVLTKNDDLSPRNPAVNDTLSRLVGSLSIDHKPEVVAAVLSDPLVQERAPLMLNRLSKAEGAMEAYWAEKLCAKEAITQNDMESFWYWGNYNDLVKQELPHLTGGANKPGTDGSICFVGSGPLPLTAIVMHQQSGRKVTCVDIDESACEVSREFLRKAGFDRDIDVVCADGAKYDYSKHSDILVAALVPNKPQVLRQIGVTGSEPVIGFRSAERLHQILYAPFDESLPELPSQEATSRTSYTPKIINTSVFYKATEGWHQAMAAAPVTPPNALMPVFEGSTGQRPPAKQERQFVAFIHNCEVTAVSVTSDDAAISRDTAKAIAGVYNSKGRGEAERAIRLQVDAASAAGKPLQCALLA